MLMSPFLNPIHSQRVFRMNEVMSELTYSSIKRKHLAREADEKKTAFRMKSILCLISHHLQEEGYTDAASTLQKEVKFDLNEYTVCDNIDLPTIIQDFESFYFMRFDKYPKLCKKLPQTKEIINKSLPVKKLQNNSNNSNNVPKKSENLLKKDEILGEGDQKDVCNLMINSTSIFKSASKVENVMKAPQPLDCPADYSAEWKELAHIISQDIYLESPNIHWDDILGLDDAKKLIKESVVYPIKYPELFSGILSPWKGLLLYGPPGTGKTLLAKAVATECKTTFFNISASSIVSKWRGDSEKLVRVLFDMARLHAPSTIFFDEIDALASHRDSPNEHESSRRLKTELLIQLDGLGHSNDLVFLLAASNIPWDLDVATLRRLEKRILVDLPTQEVREAMFKYHLPPTCKLSQQLVLNCQLDYEALAKQTNGYSGFDIKLVCKDAAMDSVRNIFDSLENGKDSPERLSLQPVTMPNMERALNRVQSSSSTNMQKYYDWHQKYGST